MQWHIWATSRWLLIISSIIKGLAGCGTRIAQQITRTGLGHQLYEAATTLSDDGIKQYLIGWRKELQNHLLSDPRRLIGRRYTMLVQHIGEDFPSVAVLRCYTEPVTSGSLGLAVTGTAWIPGCPDLLALAGACQTQLGWGIDVVLAKFKTLVWVGAIVCNLIHVSPLLYFPSLCCSQLSLGARSHASHDG